jgi:hypothetical protein
MLSYGIIRFSSIRQTETKHLISMEFCRIVEVI